MKAARNHGTSRGQPLAWPHVAASMHLTESHARLVVRAVLGRAGPALPPPQQLPEIDLIVPIALGAEVMRRGMLLPTTTSVLRSLVLRAAHTLDPIPLHSLELTADPTVAAADNLDAFASELANVLGEGVGVRVVLEKGAASLPRPRLRLVEHIVEEDAPEIPVESPPPEEPGPADDGLGIDVPWVLDLEPLAPPGPTASSVVSPPEVTQRTLEAAPQPDAAPESEPDAAPESESAPMLGPEPVHADPDVLPVERPSSWAVARGLMVMAVIVASLGALPLLLEGRARVGVWAAQIAVVIASVGFVLGQADGQAIRFGVRRRLARLGALLGRPLPAFGLLLLVLGGGIVLAPNGLGGGSHQAPVAKEGRKPKVVHRAVKRYESVLGGPAVVAEDVKLKAVDLTSAAAPKYAAARKPPPGQRWIIVRVEAISTGEKVDLSRASLRMVDNKRRIYLPDIGEGVNNAPGGELQTDTPAFWVAGYLVDAGATPQRLEIIPIMGSGTIASFKFTERH